MKCVKASWLLEVSFHDDVTSDIYIAILGAQNLSFGRLGASTLAPWGFFWQLQDAMGGPWEQTKDTRGCSAIFSMTL